MLGSTGPQPKSRRCFPKSIVLGVITWVFLSVGIFQVLPTLNTALAESPRLQSPRFTLHIGRDSGESSSTKHLERLASSALRFLEADFREFSSLFQATPKESVTVKFLSPSHFREETGAPEWTNAMFYRGEISIPATQDLHPNSPDFRSALRHEYLHAVTWELSGGRIPAWLDEGIAQYVEDSPNPILGPSLRKWLRSHKPIKLSRLYDGFMTLNDNVVPVAYAQSLFAARMLIKEHQFKGISHYLSDIRKGGHPELAFERAFGESLLAFERRLAIAMTEWASSSRIHP